MLLGIRFWVSVEVGWVEAHRPRAEVEVMQRLRFGTLLLQLRHSRPKRRERRVRGGVWFGFGRRILLEADAPDRGRLARQGLRRVVRESSRGWYDARGSDCHPGKTLSDLTPALHCRYL